MKAQVLELARKLVRAVLYSIVHIVPSVPTHPPTNFLDACSNRPKLERRISFEWRLLKRSIPGFGGRRSSSCGWSSAPCRSQWSAPKNTFYLSAGVGLFGVPTDLMSGSPWFGWLFGLVCNGACRSGNQPQPSNHQSTPRMRDGAQARWRVKGCSEGHNVSPDVWRPSPCPDCFMFKLREVWRSAAQSKHFGP